MWIFLFCKSKRERRFTVLNSIHSSFSSKYNFQSTDYKILSVTKHEVVFISPSERN